MDALTIFQQAPLYTDGLDYLLIRLPARAITLAAAILAEVGEPFGGMVVDKNEVTLIMPAQVQDDFQRRLAEAEISAPYRLITLDVELPPDLTGFMALVAARLAEAHIPLVPLGAFSRDHLLIPATHFDKAWEILHKAQGA